MDTSSIAFAILSGSVILLVVAVVWIVLKQRQLGGQQVMLAPNSKVLVVSLGSQSVVSIMETDAGVYSTAFSRVDTAVVEDTSELLNRIGARRPDILHLYCHIDQSGNLTDQRGGAVSVTSVLETCRTAGVKLLWFASDNPHENVDPALRGHKRQAGNGVDLVWTIERKGDKFAFFLGELLKRLSQGESIQTAWVGVSRTTDGPWMAKLPATLYVSNM
jgi:hypothetical protein